MERRNLTVKEAADILRVAVRTLRGYIAEGRIKVFRPGGKTHGLVLIRAEEIERIRSGR